MSKPSIKIQSETVARRILRALHPNVAPHTLHVQYVATELRLFRAHGERGTMLVVKAFDKPVRHPDITPAGFTRPGQGLSPTFRRQFEDSARKARRRG